MAKTDKNGYGVNDTLSKDDYTLNAKNADLTAFCKLLNELFAGLVKRGFIELRSVTPAMVGAVAQFDAAPIIEVVAKAYDGEATNIKFERARVEFLRGKEDAAKDIKEVVETFRKQYERDALKYYKQSEGGYWRLRYLQIDNGFVSFNRALLIDDCTNKVRDNQQEAFIKRANDLYKQLTEFNKECERRSDGAVHGIAFVYGGDAIITIGDFGDLIFDASFASLMEFDDEE